MTIYLAAFVALLLLREVVAMEAQPSGLLNRTLTLLVGLFLAILTAVRVDTGTDFPTYELIWDYTSPLAQLTYEDVFLRLLEPLFVLTTSALKTLQPEPWLFFIVYATVTMMLLHGAIRWFDVNGPHAYLVYLGAFLLPYAFNGMRQALVMSMFMYALRYFFERRTRTVVLWTMLAMGFHLTGILIGLGYFVHRITEQREFSISRWMIWGSLTSGVIGMLGLGGRLFFTIFEQKAETYAEAFNEGSSLANVAGRLVLSALLVYGALLGRPSRTMRQLLVLYSLGLFLYLGLSEFNVLATRFNMFFRVLEVILIPMVLSRLRGPRAWGLHLAFTALLLMALMAIASAPEYEYQTAIGRRLT